MTKIALGRRGRGPEARNAGDILGSGAPSALLAAAVDAPGQHRAGSGDQRADALRPAELMAGERQGVGLELAHIDSDLAHRLHGVDMQPPAGLVDKGRGLGHRLDDPGLVVGQRHGREDRAVVLAPAL
jgi:hypothetical protein